MKTTNRIERHFVYVIGILLLVVGILLIVVSNNVGSPWSYYLQTFGVAMLPTAVVAFILEYYLQHRWMVQILRSIESDVSIAAIKMGIARIFRDRDESWVERQRCYHTARNIKYLAVAPNIKLGRETMIETILSLLKNGVNFQFLVCHPDNPFATQYYGFKPSDSGMSPFKEEIWESIERLKTIQDKTKVEWGQFEYKIYRNSPGCYLQIFDGSAFFEPYLYNSEGGTPFMIKFDQGQQQVVVEKHFDAIWKNAITAKEFWSSSIGQNRRKDIE